MHSFLVSRYTFEDRRIGCLKMRKRACLIKAGCLATQIIFFVRQKKKLNLRDLIIRLWALKCKAGCLAAPERQRELDGGNFATYRWIADLPQQVAVKKKKNHTPAPQISQDRFEIWTRFSGWNEKYIYFFFSKKFFCFFCQQHTILPFVFRCFDCVAARIVASSLAPCHLLFF